MDKKDYYHPEQEVTHLPAVNIGLGADSCRIYPKDLTLCGEPLIGKKFTKVVTRSTCAPCIEENTKRILAS